jgi:hypothetical protein
MVFVNNHKGGKMKEKIQPYPARECPSFNVCSAPLCPLDPGIKMRIKLPTEDRCKAYQGLTKREWDGKRRWDSLSEAEQKRIRLNAMRNLHKPDQKGQNSTKHAF